MSELNESITYRRKKAKLRFHLVELATVFSDLKKHGIDIDQMIAEIQLENEQASILFNQPYHPHPERSL